ncbi:MAG: hypothetical protein ACM3VT_01655, partial [Solirubrobacterales bacterium]
MNRNVLAQLMLLLIVGSGATWIVGGLDRVRAGSATADEILVDPNSGRSLEGLPAWSPDTIIVKFSESVPPEIQADVLERYQCTIANSCNPGGFCLVQISDGNTPEEMV